VIFGGFGETLSFRPGEARRAFEHSTSQWLVSAVLSPLRDTLSHKWERRSKASLPTL